jgi:hypothetical protein
MMLLGPVALAVGGWGGEGPETNQIAQHGMIGLSKKDILACLSAPRWRAALGEGTEIRT